MEKTKDSTVPFSLIARLGLARWLIFIVTPVFDAFVPIFLQSGNPIYESRLLAAGREVTEVIGLGLSPSVAFGIMVIDNIFLVILSPLVGQASDTAWRPYLFWNRNRLGRRKYWIAIGIFCVAIAFPIIPRVDGLLEIFTFIVIVNFGLSIMRAPIMAWLGDFRHLYSGKESRINAALNAFSGLGGALALLGGGYLFSNYGRTTPFDVVSITVLTIGIVILYIVHEEKPILNKADIDNHINIRGMAKNIKRIYVKQFQDIFSNPSNNLKWLFISTFLWFVAFQTLSTGISSFAVFQLGLEPGLTATLVTFFPATTLIASAFIYKFLPRENISLMKKWLRVGLIGMAITFIVGFFINNQTTFSIVMIFLGGFWALVAAINLPLILKLGKEEEAGKYTGLYYVPAQLAAIAGPLISGVLIEFLFDGNFNAIWIFSFVAVAASLATLNRMPNTNITKTKNEALV